MSYTEKNNLSIGTLIKWLSHGKKVHICIHYLSEAFQNEKPFRVPYQNKIHHCSFCNAAKTTDKGLRLCVRNKSISVKKAIKAKQTYIGQCYLGITEIVKPVFFDGKPFCIIYIGNLLMDQNKPLVEKRVRKMAKISGVKDTFLMDSLDTVDIVSRETAEEYVEIIEIVSAGIELCIHDCIKNLNKQEYLENTCSKHWIIKQVLDYINQYYYTNISLCDISKLFFINEQYLCRLFSNQVGVNFSTYLNRVRIDNAMRMLSTTKKKITDISAMVGFNNVTYFNSTFKFLTTLTPSEYRRNAFNRTGSTEERRNTWLLL